uniref:hypothetical protein n=1 Tax=Xanthomonas albilineans TaxID=29447 RepID=UPI0027DD2B24|nr:hypothetical protein [Xanthomonas albilineans]
MHQPRAPRPDHAHPRQPGPIAREAIREAQALLYGGKPGLQGDDALAERERLRLEDEDKANRQGQLPLRSDR